MSRAHVSDAVDAGLIDRDLFVDRVVWRVQRDDAFGTLPVTLIYMVVFMFLVMYHLQIWNRQEMERGLEAWISGAGEEHLGTNMHNINDVYSYAEWIQQAGTGAIFGSQRAMPGTVSRYKQLRVASTSFLVGDALLKQRRYPNDAELESWMMTGEEGQKVLEANPDANGVSLLAARAQMQHLTDIVWYDDDTSDLTVLFATYSERAKMYAFTEIDVPMGNHGYVRPRVTSTAVLIEPYPQVWVFVLDALYILLILHPMYTETKDMVASLRLGCGEFLDYWNLWNIVDWVSIMMGLVNIGIWCGCIIRMNNPVLHNLLTDDGHLKPASVEMTQADNKEILDALMSISDLIFVFHITVAVNTMSIVAKFFKAFQANPRLQVVTKTLTSASTDIIHFFIVFGTIFLSFALIGHVLFGSDIVQFYTIGSSLNTGVTVLMGDFSWYVDLSDSRDYLPSGTPRLLLTFWFIIYMFFVLLVLLNMLLAVILERYTDVNSVIKGNEKLAPTLWAQTRRYFKRMNETKGFVPLYLIQKDLENDNEPAHPDQVVTVQSLMEAFPKMKQEQANWMMNMLLTEKKHKMEEETEDEATVRLKRTERFVQRIAEELHVVTLGISDCSTRISDVESRLSQIGLSEESPEREQRFVPPQDERTSGRNPADL